MLSAREDSSPWRRPLDNPRTARRILALLLAITAIVLAPALVRGFVGGDDWGWVHDVPRRDTLAKIFDPYLITPNEGPSTYYIPLQSLVYLAFVGPFGTTIGGFLLHLVLNLAHLFNGWLLWRIVRTLLLPPAGRPAIDGPRAHRETAALLSAGLFLLHPANLRTTAWVGAGVSHTLQLSLFGVACLLWIRWWREGGWIRYAGVVGLATAAALLKETAATLPVVLLVLALAARRERGEGGPMGGWVRLGAALAPFAGLTVFILAMQRLKYPLGHLSQRWGGVSLGERVPLRVLDLLTQLLAPMRQPDLLKAALGGLVAAMLCRAALEARRVPMLAGLALLTVALVLPFSIHNFRPPETLGRYLYLPSAAALPALALIPLLLAGREEAGEGGRERLARGAVGVFSGLLLLGGLEGLRLLWLGGR